MFKNFFDFSLLDGAPKDALIACRPEENGEAILVIRQPDGGVDDPRLNGYEDLFPVSMALAGKNREGGIFLDGGDWTVIAYVRQEAADYDGRYRDYLLVSLKEVMEEAHDRLRDEKAQEYWALKDEEQYNRERADALGEEVDNDSE